jgi:hypothetical protein
LTEESQEKPILFDTEISEKYQTGRKKINKTNRLVQQYPINNPIA